MAMMLHAGRGGSWQSYLKYAERRYVKKRTVIYSRGERGSGFYFLQSGLVKIVTIKPVGTQKILDLHGPGRIFGEQAVDGLPYFSTAIAADHSVLYHFSTETCKELLRASPDFFTLFVDSVIQKMQILSEGILLKTFTSEQHIACMLLKASEVCQSSRIHLTQQDLAHLTGLTRITVHKILKKWKEQDWIEICNRMIVIRQPHKLEQMM